jgi:hypothetical protein
MIVCAQLHFNIWKEIGVKLDNEHWYEHVPRLAETSHEGKLTIIWHKQVQTDSAIPNNKPDNINRDNDEGTCMLINVAISGDRDVTRKEAERILKYKTPYKGNTTHVECKTQSDTSNNRGKRNHLKIIQKMPEQRIGKARNKGTTENSHIWHRTILWNVLL